MQARFHFQYPSDRISYPIFGQHSVTDSTLNEAEVGYRFRQQADICACSNVLGGPNATRDADHRTDIGNDDPLESQLFSQQLCLKLIAESPRQSQLSVSSTPLVCRESNMSDHYGVHARIDYGPPDLPVRHPPIVDRKMIGSSEQMLIPLIGPVTGEVLGSRCHQTTVLKATNELNRLLQDLLCVITQGSHIGDRIFEIEIKVNYGCEGPMESVRQPLFRDEAARLVGQVRVVGGSETHHWRRHARIIQNFGLLTISATANCTRRSAGFNVGCDNDRHARFSLDFLEHDLRFRRRRHSNADAAQRNVIEETKPVFRRSLHYSREIGLQLLERVMRHQHLANAFP